MPELAEVETTRRDLSKIITGKKIRKVEVYLDKIVYNKKQEFINDVTGKEVLNVKRRGKWLLFELDDKYLKKKINMIMLFSILMIFLYIIMILGYLEKCKLLIKKI